MYPTNVDHQQNIFKIGNPSGEPGLFQKKKKKKLGLTVFSCTRGFKRSVVHHRDVSTILFFINEGGNILFVQFAGYFFVEFLRSKSNL